MSIKTTIEEFEKELTKLILLQIGKKFQKKLMEFGMS